MNEIFSRTEMLIGKDALSRLKDCRVAVFGIGGVGGYVAEALARSGVGSLDLFDNDTVSLSNINRQIFALYSTVGKLKTAVAKERLTDINPGIKIKEHNIFVLPSNIDEIDFSVYGEQFNVDLSEIAYANADVHETGNGVNASDAFVIQQYATGVIKSL